MAEHSDVPYIVIERERGGGLGAFVFGALCGAAAALLFAPRSGEETRRELRDGARRVRDKAEGTARQVQDSVTDTVGDLRREVVGRFDAARDALDAGRDVARETRLEMQRRVREAREAAERGERGSAGGSDDPDAGESSER